MRLLLVEDDADLARELRVTLEGLGYAVDRAADGIEGEYLGRETPYDLIVLDLGLPGRPGLEVLRSWRDDGLRTPVLVLTARDAWQERVAGFKAGGDDYLCKPFHVEELVARLQALLRRANGLAGPRLTAGRYALDEEAQQVIEPDGTRRDLTGTEFRLLRCFMLHAGELMSKTRLTEHLYDQDFEHDSNLIEVYVRRLREKLGADRIETRRGQGYIFRPDGPS